MDQNISLNNKPAYTTYDLFILIVSILSLVVLILYLLPVVGERETAILYALDSMFGLIFLYDFLRLLYRASDKMGYFFKRGGWMDLLGSFPAFPLLRLLRIWRAIRITRRLRGVSSQEAWENYMSDRAGSAVWTTLLVTIFLISAVSLAIVQVEETAPDAEITTSSDALWWSIVTVTTVGYGDLVPVTDVGRMLGAVLMTVGVALVSVITSYITTNLIMRGDQEEVKRKEATAQELDYLHAKLDRIESLLEGKE